MRIKSFRILALSVALVFLSTSSVYAGNYFGKCSSAKIYKTSKNIKGIKNILPQIKGPKKPKDHPVVKKPIKGTGVTELTLNKTTTTIAVGSWERLFASVKPANVVNKHILWFSTRPDIATVNPSGKVTGIRPGEAVIYAVSRYDFTKLATCTVTVGQNKTSPSTGQTGIYLNKTSTTMTVGSSQTLTATLKGISSSVTWYSSNPDKVSVDQSGHITAKRTGTAQIFAMTSNGQYVASCTVTVVSANKSITSVSIDTTTSYIALKPGSTKALAATVEPSTATDKSLTWSSGNTSVAVVNQSGVVTAISEGSAVITVRTINGKIDRCTIKVIPEDEWVDVTEVKINLLYTTIPVGETDTLKYSVEPSDASNKEVLWTSNDTNVISVNAAGVVEAKHTGTATITAASVDGNIEATCIITVVPSLVQPSYGILFTKINSTMLVGMSENPTVKVYPAGTYITSLTWSTSNSSIARVSQTGKVTAVAPGTAIITARASNSRIATYEVTVTD